VQLAVWWFAILLSVLGFCRVPPIAAQIQLDTAAFRRNALHLSGCYHFTQPLSDSLGVPDTVRLLLDPARELGYHRLLYFHTTLQQLEHGETVPIWRPLTADSLLIEFDPRSVPSPHTAARLAVFGDSVRGVIEKVHWKDAPSVPADIPRPLAVAARPVIGFRVHCP
jgi:hypothetical protein